MPQIWVDDDGRDALRSLKSLLQSNGLTDASYGKCAMLANIIIKRFKSKELQTEIEKFMKENGVEKDESQ